MIQGAANVFQRAYERTSLTVTVQCSSGCQRARVEYFLTPRGSKHGLVFCMTHSNGDPASKDFDTTFTFRNDGDSPSLDAQVAAAIARFVKKKVDTGQLVLPAETESPSVGPDPMNLEVEPQASSGKCFRLGLEQKIEGGFT